MADIDVLLQWLRTACSSYAFEPRGVLRRSERESWPLEAASYDALEERLEAQGNLSALPREPAAIANVIEVSVADHLQRAGQASQGVEVVRGKERVYPDLEISGPAFSASVFAVDIKVARKELGGKRTVSRITLGTGNTYFRFPDLKWTGASRPFGAFAGHVDVVVLYTFDPAALSGIRDLELIVHETWRLASKKRSSTTREYIGAVDSVAALRNGQGDFASQGEYLSYWRKFGFKIGKAVQKELDKLLASQKLQRTD